MKSPIKGTDRYATASAVAGTFFSSPATIGIATGENFPDALAAGALLSHTGAPLVLTATSSLSASTSSYLARLTGSAVQVHVFGGTSAISAAVQTAISNALS